MPAPRSLLAALLSSLVLAAAPAWAGNEAATSKAFDALLSLPQTQPQEGEWQHEAPAGFDGGDEAGLIRWLARQKKAGADFSQTRHDGTLLHHAIRGGLDATARWLLANGADPLQTLAGDSGGADALALAIEYRRWPVFEALLKLPAVLNPERTQALRKAWEAAAGKEEAAVVARLMARKLPLPGGQEGERLLASALQHQWFTLAVALTEAGVRKPEPTPYSHTRVGARQLPFPGADLETLDSRLAAPVLPFALPLLASHRDVELLFTLRLRRPFADAAFTQGIVRTALDAGLPAGVLRALVERIPRGALKAAFEDPVTLAAWTRWLSGLPNPDRAWALDMLGELPARQPALLLAAMLKDRYTFDEYQADANLAATWEQVLARLHAPLPAQVNGKLWMFVPQAQRASLLRLGYRPTAKELEDWFDRSKKETIRAFLPQLKNALPAFNTTIHASLLAPVAIDAEMPCNGSHLDQDLMDKARFLVEVGVKPEQPVTLDAGCRQEAEPGVLRFLETAAMVAPAPPATPGRFKRSAPACTFRPNDAWRAALTAPGAGDALVPEGMQPVAIPGEADCALLVFGGDAGGRRFFDEDSFTGSQRFTPCTDGDLAAELWRMAGDKLVRAEVPANDGPMPLRDTGSGQEVMLIGGTSMGGCGQVPYGLLAWRKGPNGAPVLEAVARSTPVMQAFLQQCGPQLAGCPELDPTSDANPPATGPDFIETHWAAQRQAYVDAVLAYDVAALRALGQAGVFPDWTLAAIEAVSKAGMPLAEKRRRTAWLFRNGAQLRRAMLNAGQPLLDDLLGWLPAQDWGPLIAVLKGSGKLDSLRSSAAQQGKHQLACRFTAALGQSCTSQTREE
jgi:hypothetical protein